MRATPEMFRAWLVGRCVLPAGRVGALGYFGAAFYVTVTLRELDPLGGGPARDADVGRLWSVSLYCSNVPEWWTGAARTQAFELVDLSGRFVRWEFDRVARFMFGCVVDIGPGATMQVSFEFPSVGKAAGRWGPVRRQKAIAAQAGLSAAGVSALAADLSGRADVLSPSSPRRSQYLARASVLNELAASVDVLRAEATEGYFNGGID